MLKRDIEVDGKLVPFRASATITLVYNGDNSTEIFKDLMKLGKSVKNVNKESSDIPLDDLEMFENVAYIMAKHADPEQPDNVEEWLDQFSTFSIYEVLPKILELWNLNIQTDVKAKKK